MLYHYITFHLCDFSAKQKEKITILQIAVLKRHQTFDVKLYKIDVYLFYVLFLLKVTGAV